MFRQITSSEEDIDKARGVLSYHSKEIQRSVKGLFSSMLHMPTERYAAQEASLLNVSAFIRDYGSRLNIGQYDSQGFALFSFDSEEAATLVREVMGYHGSTSGEITNLEIRTMSSFVSASVSKVVELLSIPVMGFSGPVQMERFTYEDDHVGVIQKVEARIKGMDIEIDMYVSLDLLGVNGHTDHAMVNEDQASIDLFVEMYSKMVSLGEVGDLRVGSVFNLPEPDKVTIKERGSGKALFSGNLGEVSGLKSVQISKIHGENNV